MTERSRYWRVVLILTVLFCVLATLGYWVAPGVRTGSVPAVGGVVWHLLGATQLLIGPIATRVAQATSPRLGSAALVALTGVSALLLAMAIGLPFYLIDRPAHQSQAVPRIAEEAG